MRNDLLLIGVLMLSTMVLFLFLHFFTGKEGTFVQVSVDGEVIGCYPLTEEQTIAIQGYAGFENILVIKDGKADIIEAACPDQVCVRQKSISHVGESLICLPNRVVVEVIGTGENEVDAVAN